ncbi:MAG: fructose-1,6-bisphosphatase/inositol monophosphatase family enzyme [Sulfurimonas sp.]|jgi:fructose-1,6-bisphosphatase/inositol monophosphatase family enzyme|uniref:inositol monophosphatase family protein n=1 Tax=Sulfurimonas sp. TaxID=2022749 RepID=UPI0039E651D9
MRNIYLIIAKQIVEEAGRIIREARETNTFTFEFKSDDTPISNLDQQVQNYMSKRLKDSFDIQVMGEEECDSIDESKPYWAIDPIDGTWAFITHENTSAINLSLIDNGEVILGIVFNPFTQEFFQTEKGAKSYIGMLTLPLRDNPSVAVVNFKPEREHPIVKSVNQLFKENKIKKLTSIGGSITYSMCMVAKGAFSNYIAYFNFHANAWDISAAYIIIKNSGGFVTDLEGEEIDPIHHKGYIVASANANARDDFLAMINPLLGK